MQHLLKGLKARVRGKYHKWVISTFWAALLMRSLSAASTNVARVVKIGEDRLVTPKAVWCVMGIEMCLNPAEPHCVPGSRKYSPWLWGRRC